MVLKSIVRYLMNRYLKNYIEQLDEKKFTFDLRTGHVTFENLHLKPEALADLNLPVTVAGGYLEKLSLTIPWMNLSTHKTKIHVMGLYMLIVPKDEVPRDLSEYHANKMKRVQRKVENLNKSLIESVKLEEKEGTFFDRIRLQIMQNLEMTIENIHLSYETNSTTKLGHPFSFGLTLKHLQINSIIQSNQPKRSKQTIPIIYTIENIRCLSVYWNTKCQSRVEIPLNLLIDHLRNQIIPDNSMNYILYPVDLQIKLLVKLTTSEHNFERPSFDIDIQLNDLRLNLDSSQFSDLLDFIKFQNYSQLYERCREYRQLYYEDFLNQNPLNEREKERLIKLQRKLDVFNLAYIHHSVQIEIEDQLSTDTPKQSSRFTSWWKKKSHQRRTSLEPIHKDGFSFYFDDVSNLSLSIKIEELYLYLVSRCFFSNKRNLQIISDVRIQQAKINVTKHSISSSVLFVLSLGLFQLYGMKNDQGECPLILQSLSKSPSIPMLTTEFELYPSNNSLSDYRFKLNLQPIHIIYDYVMFNRIVECFEKMNKKTTFWLMKIKERTNSEMEKDLSLEKILDLSLDLKEIFVQFPQNAFLRMKNNSIFNIKLNDLKLRSSLEDIAQREKRFYFKYQFELKNIQMNYFSSDQMKFHLFKSIDQINMDLFKCIYFDDLILEDWNFNIRIENIRNISINSKIFNQLTNHFQSIDKFQSTFLEILYRINLYFEAFPPLSSIRASLSIDQCSFSLNDTNPSMIIETNLFCSLWKGREKFKELIFILTNLIITNEKLSNVFYRNKSFQLKYHDN